MCVGQDSAKNIFCHRRSKKFLGPTHATRSAERVTPRSFSNPALRYKMQRTRMLAHSGSAFWCVGQDSNLRSPKAANLQSATIDRSVTYANWHFVAPVYSIMFFCPIQTKYYTTSFARVRVLSAVFFSTRIAISPFSIVTATLPPLRIPCEIMSDATGVNILFWIKRLSGRAP